jgi:hypothetical protein
MHDVSLFRVEEYAKQEDSMKHVSSISALKMEATRSFETSDDFQRKTKRYILQNINLNKYIMIASPFEETNQHFPPSVLRVKQTETY